MKRILLTILSVAVATAMSYGQFSADFEDGLQGFEPLGGGAVVEAADNPNGDGQVMKITKGGEVWSGAGNLLDGFVKYTDTDSTVTFSFYGDAECTIDVGFENSANYNNSGYAPTANYTNPGEWQEFAVTIEGGADRNQNKLIIKPDGNHDVGEGSVWYVDDVSFPMELEQLPYDPSDVSFTLNVEGAALDNPAMKYVKDGDDWANAADVPAMDGSTTVSLDTGDYFVRVYDGDDIVKDSVGFMVVGWGNPLAVTVTVFNLPEEDGTATATQFETAPTIDGAADEAVWEDATEHYVAHAVQGEPTDLAYFKLGWDMDHLYVLNVVNDQEIGVTEAIGSTWNGDNVEVFFDMKQLELGDGEMTSDNISGIGIWQLRYLPIEGNEIWDGAGYVSAEALFTGLDDWSAVSSTVERAVKVTEGEKYVMEWKIPWATLTDGFLAMETSEFNFDVGIGDAQEAGGTRNSIAAWAGLESTGDVNYQYTEEYGTVTLGGSESTGLNDVAAQNMKMNVYPVPVRNTLNISGMEVESAAIYNMVGSKVMDVRNENTINVSSLKRGIYTIVVNNGPATKFIVE